MQAAGSGRVPIPKSTVARSTESMSGRHERKEGRKEGRKEVSKSVGRKKRSRSFVGLSGARERRMERKARAREGERVINQPTQ